MQLCFWSVSRTFHFFAILIFKFIFFSCFYWCFPRIFWVDLISFIPYDCYYSAWMTFHNAQYPRFEIFEESNFKPFNNTVCLQFLRSQYLIILSVYIWHCAYDTLCSFFQSSSNANCQQLQEPMKLLKCIHFHSPDSPQDISFDVETSRCQIE